MHRASAILRNILPRIQKNGSFPPGRIFNLKSRDYSEVKGHLGSLLPLGSQETGHRPTWGLLAPTQHSQQICRNKSKRAKGGKKRGQMRVEKEEFSDDSDDDIELESGLDFRDMRVKVPSLRMDAILKAGLKMARSKVETAFYASKIRVNGEKVLKKSKQVREGDDLDVIKGASDANGDTLEVSRVVILRVGRFDEDSEKYEVVLRRYTRLLVPKYDDFGDESDDLGAPR